MRYRHKPTKIEAVQLSADTDYPEWMQQAIADGRIVIISQGSQYPAYAEVDTPEGRMVTGPGSWIAKGVSGELYAIREDLFGQLYEFDADGVIDTWAGNWIISVTTPSGLMEEQMLDRYSMEASRAPWSHAISAFTDMFTNLWPRRDEENPNG